MKKVYVSRKAYGAVMEYLKSRGYEVSPIGDIRGVYGAIDSHPDICMCKMGTEPSSPVLFAKEGSLGASYPGNIAYNAVWLDRHFIHNVKYTAPELLALAINSGLKLVSVRQGYTKCSVVVVDGRSLITSDEGICKTLLRYPELDVLKIRPCYVNLEGFDHGFIGGASGRVGDEIVFNGDISLHPDFGAVKDFINGRGIGIKYFEGLPLADVGSIIECED